MGTKSYTELERQMAIDIYRDRGATAAAKEIGCSRQAIYDWLGEEMSTDDSDLKERAERHTVYRGLLRDRLIRTALRLVDRCTEPFVAYDKEGMPHELEEPPGFEVQKMMTAAGIALDKYRLEMGESTGRTESITIGALEAELTRLNAELGAQGDAASDSGA